MGESISVLRVLVVDDEKSIVYSLCAILEIYKHRVRSAHSAEEALEIAREFRPDVLLSDIVMPGMNGIELALRVRRLLPGCEVLLMSGQTTHQEQLQIARAEGHALEVAQKPFHPREILAFLESCGRGR